MRELKFFRILIRPVDTDDEAANEIFFFTATQSESATLGFPEVFFNC